MCDVSSYRETVLLKYHGQYSCADKFKMLWTAYVDKTAAQKTCISDITFLKRFKNAFKTNRTLDNPTSTNEGHIQKINVL